MWRMIAIGLALLLPACEGGPNSPENEFPNVAGTYVGTLEFRVSSGLGPPVTARITVVQAGSQLTTTGTWTVNGQTGPMPVLTGNINATGYFTVTSGGAATVVDPLCGTMRQTDLTITFVSNTLQYFERDATDTCGLWTFTGTLVR